MKRPGNRIEIRTATQLHDRLREVAGALAMLALGSCTGAADDRAPGPVETRVAELGVGQCETFTASATKQYVTQGAPDNRPWCAPDKQLKTQSVFDNYLRKFDQKVKVKVPSSIPIADDPDAGNAGNHHATFEVRTYTECDAYTAVTCLYRGGSAQSHPTSADQLAKAAGSRTSVTAGQRSPASRRAAS